MKPLLTVAIPTWNNLQQLEWCIKSLFKHTEYPLNVIIVDNGGKGEVKFKLDMGNNINNKLPITVIEPKENLGWMGAINLALEDCDTEYFCMLNDDVVFIPNQQEFWRVLLSNFNEGRVGAVNPCSNFVAGAQSLMYMDTSVVFNSAILIGFCLAIRTNVLKDLGGLDPTLPGGDDLDLSIRLTKAGYDLRVDKRCYLHHFGQQTGSRVHEGHWDSSWHQELTNNAIIKKHGVKAWYDCFRMGWANIESMVNKLESSREDLWLEEITKKFDGEQGLNIGCGDKKIEGALGVDINDSTGDAGGQKGKDSKAELIADAADIPLDAGSQSYIVATHILEHTIDVLRTMKEWFRLLREDGMLFLSVPNHDRLSTMLIDYTHVHAFNKDALQNLIETCGFKIDNIEEDEAGAIRVEARKVAA